MLAARAIPGIQIPAISPVTGSSLMAISCPPPIAWGSRHAGYVRSRSSCRKSVLLVHFCRLLPLTVPVLTPANSAIPRIVMAAKTSSWKSCTAALRTRACVACLSRLQLESAISHPLNEHVHFSIRFETEIAHHFREDFNYVVANYS